MSSQQSHHIRKLLELNFTMIIMSTSGALGKYISLPPALTIWWRCFLGALLIGLFIKAMGWKVKPKSPKDLRIIVISGILLGGHWITYFYALQLSNVAIGMLSLFTYPMITSLLEPVLYRTPFKFINIVMGIVVIIAVYFLVPAFDFSNDQFKGVLFGIFSSVLYSFRNLLLKEKVVQYQGSVIMFMQLTTVVIVLLPIHLFVDGSRISTEWEAVLTLSIVTTAIGHSLFVMSFKHFSISIASLISSLQPIYGIIIAMIFLGEIPTGRSIIGGALIVGTVVVASVQSFKKE